MSREAFANRRRCGMSGYIELPISPQARCRQAEVVPSLAACELSGMDQSWRVRMIRRGTVRRAPHAIAP